MGIDPATADHVADAVDQEIEKAGVQVERIISAAEETSEPLAAKERAAIVGKLEGATEDVEQAVERVETVIAANADSQAPLDDLERATQHFEDAVHDASTNGACQESPLLGRREESAGLRSALRWSSASCTALPQQRSPRPVHWP
jgi:ABC-type transporter Mla subunit MlaD